MAIPQIITANRRQYVVQDDTDFVRLGLVRGTIYDSVTGGPPATDVLVEVDRTDLFVRVEQNRWFAISGNPVLAFPSLASQSVVLNVAVVAAGYQRVRFPLVIPQNASFPIVAPDVALKRDPVRLEGRVTTADTNRAPIADALIHAVDSPGSGATAHLHLSRRPARIDRPRGTMAQARALNTVVLAGERRLVSPVTVGSRVLRVSSRQGLAPGQILRLGSARDGEFAVIESVSTQPADPSWPGLVNVHGAFQHGFPDKAAFQVFTSTPTGPALSLVEPVSAGTSVLVLDGSVGSDVLALTGAGQPPEYHLIGALTDADGYYRVDGVGSVPLLYLNAAVAGFSPLAEPIRWMVLYDKAVNRVDFRLAP